MKKRIENIKKNYKSDSQKTLFLVLGFVSGAAISKGLDWLAGKYPQYESTIRYGKPIAIGGGGWLLSASSNENETFLKYSGFGLATAGAFEGIKLLPVAKEYLSGIESGIGKTYYMEEDKPLLNLGDFGINALPVKNVSMENAPRIKVDLPDLEGAYNIKDDIGKIKESNEDIISGLL
jgi:hypothetical protein